MAQKGIGNGIFEIWMGVAIGVIVSGERTNWWSGGEGNWTNWCQRETSELLG